MLPENVSAEIVKPARNCADKFPIPKVEAAIEEPIGGVDLKYFNGVRSAAIAISDKIRPVPNHDLLPPLLRKIARLSLTPSAIHLFISTGLHPHMEPSEYSSILPDEILARNSISCHNADNKDNLIYLSDTQRGTPVWVNREYAEADLRIVVGDIDSHQFQGFSGGVKSAAIGLAGRATITANHSMMNDSEARVGSFDTNPGLFGLAFGHGYQS